MELSLEAYIIVVHYAGRQELPVLCRVSRGFQIAAERALYNTLFIREDDVDEDTPQDGEDTREAEEQAAEEGEEVMGAQREIWRMLCNTLASTPRVAVLVDALTVVGTASGSAEIADIDEDSFWHPVSRALRATVRLRYLNIHVLPLPGSVATTRPGSARTSSSSMLALQIQRMQAQIMRMQQQGAWVLTGCGMKLRTFHCEFAWNADLVAFLDGQDALDDLFITDFESSVGDAAQSQTREAEIVEEVRKGEEEAPDASSPMSIVEVEPREAHGASQRVREGSLPNLSIIECTFVEAATSLVPGRPITRLKTSFSVSPTDRDAKRQEIRSFMDSLRRSKKRFLALDVADAAYTEEGTMELLEAMIGGANVQETRTPSGSTTRRRRKKGILSDLRYLGILVLPIGGRERLQFYALLRRLRKLTTVELEVSEWDPPPRSFPQLRSLSAELRLYCPSIRRVVFVRDFDRMVITYDLDSGIEAPGGGRLGCRLDEEVVTELLWREV